MNTVSSGKSCMDPSGIVLINPYLYVWRSIYSQFFLPHGLAVLVSSLRRHKRNVALYDASYRIEEFNGRCRGFSKKGINVSLFWDEKRIARYVLSGKKDRVLDELGEKLIGLFPLSGAGLIGITIAHHHHHPFALFLVKFIRKYFKTPIVIGGSFVTLFDRFLMEQLPSGVFLCKGDGEVPLLALWDSLQKQKPLSMVPNLVFSHNGVITENKVEHFPLEDQSPPDYSDLPDLNFYSERIDTCRSPRLMYEVTSGCLNRCVFCARSVIKPYFQVKSPSKVVRELREMKTKHAVNTFDFVSDSLNYDKDYLHELCDALIDADLGLDWMSMIRCDRFDRELALKMKQAGCSSLTIGVESGSNRVLRRMGKNATAQDSSNAIKIMFEAGIRSKIIFLTGFLFETKEDLEESIRFIKEHARYVTQGLCKVNFFALTYRTPIYEDPSLFGIENIRPLATAFGIPVTFAFDEKGGLRWEEKKKQQKLYSMTLTKVMLKYVLIKKFRIKFLPPAVLFWGKKFWAFMWVKIGHLRYARMAEKFIFFLLKK